METIFEEWCIYASKKKLADRDFDYTGLVNSSRLKIVAITGIRRSGKTSILITLYNRLIQKREKAAYINLEDSRIKDTPGILDEILKWFGDSGYLLLDEITSVKGWAGWLARNHELLKGSLKLIVCSSRSSLVYPSKALRGRILSYELYPLSFKEYLRFKGVEIERTVAGIGRIERGFQDYLIYGGFPEVALLKEKTDKINVLNSYFKDIIGLDVAEISRENLSLVETFGKYILDAPYFSASKCLNFFKTLGYRIAKQKLLYLEKFSQESYLFFFIPIYSRSIKNRSQYPRKSYAGDSGFMYAISGRTDMGRLFETLVFLELKRRMPFNREIQYWKNKDGFEADFVVREGVSAKELIQVVYDLKRAETKCREVRGLVACAKEFNKKGGLVLTKDFEHVEVVEGVKIRYIPLWKWLLA